MHCDRHIAFSLFSLKSLITRLYFEPTLPTLLYQQQCLEQVLLAVLIPHTNACTPMWWKATVKHSCSTLRARSVRRAVSQDGS
ncbi:hypothetical protein PMIN06_011577 [Paraphaeosphaeria minitans]